MDARNEAIEEIRERLESILTTNTNPRTGQPFNTSIGRNVTYGKLDTPTPQDAPGVNFSDGSEDASDQYGRNAREMVITIEGYDYDREAEVIKIANDMLFDVESVLLYDDGVLKQKLGGKCYEIRFSKKDPFMLEDDVPLCGAVMDFIVKFDP